MTLDEATIEQLFAEIASRCGGAVLAITMDEKVDSGKEVGNTFYQGGRYQAIGLLREAERALSVTVRGDE